MKEPAGTNRGEERNKMVLDKIINNNNFSALLLSCTTSQQ